MNRYISLSFIALITFVVILPVYAVAEQQRLDQAQLELREQFIDESTIIYAENCADCHGPSGQGSGAMPALTNLAAASREALHQKIAHSPHGTAMAAWHLQEGGILNDYQVEALATLIQYGRWDEVAVAQPASAALAAADYSPNRVPAVAVDEAFLRMAEGRDEEDPHECVSCHEEPAVHVGQFGLHCARCHSLKSWTPAFLTMHTFMLDHGGEGQLSCQGCHVQNYVSYSCYECHDHQPQEMDQVHRAEGLPEYADCARCHPTGRSGEGRELMETDTVFSSHPQGEDGFGMLER